MYTPLPARPSYANTSAGADAATSSYNNYSAVAPTSTPAHPPGAAQKSGLGLVTAGAFFIALAVGIFVFKEDDRGLLGRNRRYNNDRY
jgi:hypothetical protein